MGLHAGLVRISALAGSREVKSSKSQTGRLQPRRSPNKRQRSHDNSQSAPVGIKSQSTRLASYR
jgi:hypothetical protein